MSTVEIMYVKPTCQMQEVVLFNFKVRQWHFTVKVQSGNFIVTLFTLRSSVPIPFFLLIHASNEITLKKTNKQ